MPHNGSQVCLVADLEAQNYQNSKNFNRKKNVK